MLRYIAVVIAVAILGFALMARTSRNKTPATIQPSLTTSSADTITIENNRFSPTTLTISVGDTVTFINKDSVSHQLASDPHPTHTDYPPLNVGVLPPIGTDGVAQTITFTKKGGFGYHDHLNPGIRGKIIVK